MAPVVYAVNELDDGALSAFSLGSDGDLVPLGSWPTGGALPCHLTVTPDDQIVVANYGSGSVATFGLDGDARPTGRADLVEHCGSSKHPERQQGPHAHHVFAAGGGVFAVDLGLDAVLRYRLDPATGELTAGEVAVTLPPGTGPRHPAVAPNGIVYLVGELTATVITLRPGPASWAEIGTVPSTSAPSEGTAPSEIAVSADGRFLYVANRGPATIAVFSLAAQLPTLVAEVPTGGAWPRHFVLVEPYLYVANQLGNLVTVFHLDPATGVPSATGDVLATPSPTCLLPITLGH